MTFVNMEFIAYDLRRNLQSLRLCFYFDLLEGEREKGEGDRNKERKTQKQRDKLNYCLLLT